MEIITGKYSIKQIFNDHWAKFLEKHRKGIPDYVMESVQKMLACRNPDKLGYHRYVCPEHPGQSIVVPHSCKSNFCNTCGKVMADKWQKEVSEVFPNTPFYHITFTVSDKLRPYFFLLPKLRALLFKAAAETVLGWFKQRKVLPAIACVLHTYGRDGKFHPHIHMICSAGGISLKTGKDWKEVDYLPWNAIKGRWRAILLTKLKQVLPEDLKQTLFNTKWYVNVGLRSDKVQSAISYLGRYAKKPVIAETRIIDYNGQRVRFVFQDYRTESKVIRELPAENFIFLLVQHIPPKGFRMIRYYGLLANRTKTKWHKVLQSLSLIGSFKAKYLSWRERQTKFKGKDPLICPVCGKKMVLAEIAYWSHARGKLVVKEFN